MDKEQKHKRKHIGGQSRVPRQFPHVYIILLSLIFVSAALTWIVRAGEYDRVQQAGREVVDAKSYHTVEQCPVGVMGFLEVLHKGMMDTSNIIFFIFIVGGSFGILQATGAVTAALQRLAKSMQNKGIVSIPVIMAAFGFAGAVIGMAEETLPFIPIIVSLMMGLGFDSITGAAVVLCGAGAGFASAFMNPFTIGIAQGIAGLPMFSALLFRVVMFVCFEVLTIVFVCVYASRARKENCREANIKSTVSNTMGMEHLDEDKSTPRDTGKLLPFAAREKAILAVFALTLFGVVFGVIKYGWYMTEISALFLAMSFVVAAIGHLGMNGYAENLARSMAGITSGALIVGFAKGIPIVLQEGKIMDTMLHGAAVLLDKLPVQLTASGMYVVQCLLNFLLPSGGGQAAVSMPIMSPLADMVGITRQTAVVAFQLGDGISNVFFPTSGYFMAGLALAGIPWQKWAKAVLPLILSQYALGLVFVLAAQAIKLGPW